MIKHPDPDADAIRKQVLRGIAGNRTPGLHFPGFFLDIQWEKIAGKAARIAIADGPHCRDANGEVDIAALAIIADTALATATRLLITPGARLATIHMQMQFTGAPATGEISAAAELLGFGDGAALHQSLTTGTLHANGKPICYATGEFVLLNPPPGVTLAPLPWQHTDAPAPGPLTADALDARELPIIKACDAALAKSSAQVSFVQHFWGGAPQRTANGAAMRVAIGPHLGNRVGHVQGGISFGMAAACACAALPATMMLSNVSAWYISPGHGKSLSVKSHIVHAGRSSAVVRTEIKTATGERVLEVMTQHIARKRD
ncbi:MAG: hotdog domain-containing protein [Burkholderiales bacterium]